MAGLVQALAPALLVRPEAAAPFHASITPAAFTERLASPRFGYALARADGALVGLVGMRDGTHLHHLFVAAAFQRQGLGRRLWDHARAYLAAGRGPLTVNASRNAVTAYRRWGFEATGPEVQQHGVAFTPMAWAAD